MVVVFVVVAPFQSADFRLPSRGGNGEIHDGLHGDLRAPVTPLEVLAQPRELVCGWPSRAFSGLADQSQLAAGGPCLLHDTGIYRKLPDALGSPQHNSNPDQIVDHGRGAGIRRAARLHMPDQVGGREGVRNGFAERMPLQELQMGLLAALPARDRLKGVDVSADQLRKGIRALLDPRQGCRVFERHFAVLGPASGRRAMRKGSALLMQHRRATANANYSRVARRTVRLFAYFDRWHDDF